MVGTSRLPLREALCVLKGLGLIEAKHGKGVFVRELDLGNLFSALSPLLKTHAQIDVRHLFEARLHLEPAIAEQAAANHRDEDLWMLQQAVEGMRDGLAERTEFFRWDMTFHQELARSTGNPIFHVFMASITELLNELQLLYFNQIEIRRLAVDEHAEILQAIREGQGARAREAMQKHLQNATQRVD
jgi:GntR family transcriptional repressor for pyruvate dehydrogenase complex